MADFFLKQGIQFSNDLKYEFVLFQKIYSRRQYFFKDISAGTTIGMEIGKFLDL